MELILGVLMRAVHIGSVVVAIGGVAYARFSGCGYSTKFRGWTLGAMLGIVVSGIYNFLTKPGFPPGYHLWFGIKMLLVLHILSMLFLLAKGSGDEIKRNRWMTGVVISGAAVILISSYLRWISLGVAYR